MVCARTVSSSRCASRGPLPARSTSTITSLHRATTSSTSPVARNSSRCRRQPRIRRVLLVGIGDDAELTPADFRKAIGAAASALKGAPVRDAVLAIDAFKVAGYDAYQKARVALALLTAQLYRFAASKQQDETPPTQIAQLTVHSDARGQALPPTRCVTHRRSTPEWRSRAISAISRRTSATRRFSHPKRENYRAARPRRIACA